jgi:hypothetical protein
MTMFETPAYHPQFTPPTLFGGFPGHFGQFGPQQFGGMMGQTGRMLPFETGLPGVGPTSFLPPGVFGNQLGSLGHLPGGWPTVQQFAGGGYAPQIPLGALLGLYGQCLAQAIGGWPGHAPLAGFAPQSLFGALSPYPLLMGHATGGWPGQIPLGGFVPQSLLGALPGQYGQQIGAFGGWPGQQQLGNQLAGVMGRSVLPYQAAPQIAYAG